MADFLTLGGRVLTGAAGVVLVVLTVSAAIRSFVLPRNEAVQLNIFLTKALRFVFDAAARLAPSYERRDRIMAHYAPVALVALPVVWLTLVSAGYTLLYWSLGAGDWDKSYKLSGSALLTLGTAKDNNLLINVLSFSEATLGLLLLTLLISYLPTLYQAFSRREVLVAQLELRAGTPVSAAALLGWLNSSGSLQDDDAEWAAWEQWFVEIEESHTSLPILSFFRSPQPGRSWVVTAGLVLETANLLFSALDVPHTRQMQLTFTAGCLSLNRVYRFFDEQAGAEGADFALTDAASLAERRRCFGAACDRLAADGFALRPDRAAAWEHYRERRHRYAPALAFLGRLMMAPDSTPV